MKINWMIIMSIGINIMGIGINITGIGINIKGIKIHIMGVSHRPLVTEDVGLNPVNPSRLVCP